LRFTKSELARVIVVVTIMNTNKPSRAGRAMDSLLDPDDWLARRPGLCLSLIAALVLVVDWIAPVA
jgi:hypothetical protein